MQLSQMMMIICRLRGSIYLLAYYLDARYLLSHQLYREAQLNKFYTDYIAIGGLQQKKKFSWRKNQDESSETYLGTELVFVT